MDPYPKPLRELISQLKRLPGIGEKTATRLALYVLGEKGDLAEGIANALKMVRQGIKLCPICFNITDKPTCVICQDISRDRSTICIVEDPSDVLAIESTHIYKGLYHVLHGLVSPINGVSPEDIRIPELISRVKGKDIKEVIIATSPSVEGEATAHYIYRALRDKTHVGKVSRIVSGIPMGAELKYMDQATLASALRYRQNINE